LRPRAASSPCDVGLIPSLGLLEQAPLERPALRLAGNPDPLTLLSSAFESMCQQTTASLRALATSAIDRPRRRAMRS